MVHDGKFYPLKDALTQLLTECARIRRDGSQHCWMDKRGIDLVSAAQNSGVKLDGEEEDGPVDEEGPE